MQFSEAFECENIYSFFINGTEISITFLQGTMAFFIHNLNIQENHN